MIPQCPECGRPMQLNTASSTEVVQQFVCGCGGKLKYHNEHKGQKKRDGN